MSEYNSGDDIVARVDAGSAFDSAVNEGDTTMPVDAKPEDPAAEKEAMGAVADLIDRVGRQIGPIETPPARPPWSGR